MGRQKLQDEQVQEARERMTRAAVTLYRQGGLDALTFRELGQALGVSHVTPYRYFASKDDLVAAVRTAVFDDFDAYLRAFDRTTESARVRMRSFWHRVLAFGRQQPEDYRLLFSLSVPADNDYLPLRAARQRTLKYLCDIYRNGVERGELHGNPLVSVQLLFAATHGLVSLHLAGQMAEAALPVEELLDSMVLALLK